MKTTLKQIQALGQDLTLLQASIQRALDETQIYNPKTPTNWASPPPGNIVDALDRISAALKTLLGTQIP